MSGSAVFDARGGARSGKDWRGEAAMDSFLKGHTSMKRKYKRMRGSMMSADQAIRLGAFLEQIGERATPKQIVDAARNRKSIIHDLFDWDDSTAAEKYRIWQARHHVATLSVVVVTPKGDKNKRAYHSVVVDADELGRGKRAYCSSASIMSDAELAKQVIDQALRELDGWQSRYSQYRSEFAPVFTAARKVRQKLQRRKTIAA